MNQLFTVDDTILWTWYWQKSVNIKSATIKTFIKRQQKWSECCLRSVYNHIYIQTYVTLRHSYLHEVNKISTRHCILYRQKSFITSWKVHTSGVTVCMQSHDAGWLQFNSWLAHFEQHLYYNLLVTCKYIFKLVIFLGMFGL